jgi:hypothetical protein
MIPAAYLIDLYRVLPREDLVRLEVQKIVNEPGLPVLLLLLDGDREIVIDAFADISVADTYLGLGDFTRRLAGRARRAGGEIDYVIAAPGLYPFRV